MIVGRVETVRRSAGDCGPQIFEKRGIGRPRPGKAALALLVEARRGLAGAAVGEHSGLHL
jgi:hypothetical protein